MKLFRSLRSLALLLMVGAGAAYAADAVKPAKPAEAAKPAATAAPAKTAEAAKPVAAKPAAKKVAKKVAKKAPVKVVYHLNQGNENASLAMNNIKNHLAADPTAKIVVVTHGKGIDFLLKDAKDAKGNDYSKSVEELSLKGVDFRVCNNTLVGRKIDPTTVISEAKIVPAGVVEISNLQAHEHYVYVKP